jgi:Na+-transporting methylmalonyl-CoA/oxaloacetate decarboxylase gamma subunit
MSDLLVQGLQLTVLGMGMTFASIGALVVGMYLMTAVTRTRRSRADVSLTAPDDEGERVSLESAALESGRLSSPGDGEDGAEDRTRVRAAAAAVAVALAEAEATADAVMSHPSDNAWDIYVRSRHLSRRTRYDLRR